MDAAIQVSRFNHYVELPDDAFLLVHEYSGAVDVADSDTVAKLQRGETDLPERELDGFPHSSCCGIPNGCDDTFNAGNLSAYGVQWWLNKLWLDGTIDVGMGCQSPFDLSNSTSWFVGQVNSNFPPRFCLARPPILSTPAMPGGACHDVKRRRAVRHS